MGRKNKFKKCKNIIYNADYLNDYEKEDDIEIKYTLPKNESQKRYIEQLNQSENRIIIATGPAGTGKTLFATEYGIKFFLEKRIDKIIFVRPTVSVDEEIGFLPGKLEEKMAPWIRPIYDVLYRFIPNKDVEYLMEQKKIEIVPLAYMRGRTFKNTWIIADEMQNSTISQMKMLLTRLGEKSKMIITGDLEQNDLGKKMNGLEDFLDKFRGRRSDSISSIEFNICDVEREKVVREVLDIYSGNTIPLSYMDTIDNDDE